LKPLEEGEADRQTPLVEAATSIALSVTVPTALGIPDIGSQISKLFAAADYLERRSMHVVGGKLDVADLVLFREAQKQRLAATSLVGRHAEQLHDLTAMSDFYTSIVEEISKVAPDMQRRLMLRLKEINSMRATRHKDSA
jgi:hypothetical protein